MIRAPARLLALLFAAAGGACAAEAPPRVPPGACTDGPRFREPESFSELSRDPAASGFLGVLRPLETAARLGSPRPAANPGSARAAYVEAYARAATRFTARERDAIASAVAVVRSHSADIDGGTAATWEFARVEDSVEGGMPHTVAGVIALPRGFVEALARAGGSAAGERVRLQSVAILAHERLHVLQRRAPEAFERLYRDAWGLSRRDAIRVPAELDARRITNPDAFGSEWTAPASAAGRDELWPVLLLRDGASLSLRSRLERGVVRIRDGRASNAADGPSGEAFARWVAARVGPDAVPDHPHEMSAAVYASEVVRRVRGDPEPGPEERGRREFVAWCRTQLARR